MSKKINPLKNTPSKKSKSITRKLEIAKKYGLSKQDLIEMLHNIYLSRRLDDAEIAMKKQAKAFFQISGAGHEGILSGFGRILRGGYDYFFPYYRDRALCLALGITPYEMLCQANGNTGDTSSYGRQMPAHWGNEKLNIITQSSCTGTQFLHAVGAADAGVYLQKLAQTGPELPSFNQDEIVYVSCGDGTIAQGEFWEAITSACVNNLPVLFLVEDNGYAISVPASQQVPGGSISKALRNFPGLKVYEVDGNCPVESFACAKEACAYIRKNRSPALVHAHVTRPYSHSMSDDHSTYRTKEELKEEADKDVINSYPRLLMDANILKPDEFEKIKQDISEIIKDARSRVLDTPWPSPEEAGKHLYSEKTDITSSQFSQEAVSSDSELSMALAINTVLKEEVKNNPLIRVFGEDVADFTQLEKYETALPGKGGVFKITHGVQKAGIKNQVFNSPLAEANIVGRAIGMALRGLTPVVEIQFFDYIWTAFMQIKNEMATIRYRSGGDFTCPLIIRVPIGGYLKGGAIYHSQCGESIFTHIPGLRVAFPSNAADAAGLLRTAIRADDPVMFLEHKHLYYQGYNRSQDPGKNYMIPFGKASILAEGDDVTILCWGALVQKSLDAAKSIQKKQGKTIEVIDARTLAPFDMETLKTSLSKTNRIVIAHEETKTSGFAGEIAARINEECFSLLDAPITRVAAQDTHVAYNPKLEELILPQVSDVEKALLDVLSY
ncbi:MAG: thiamine pyrophosphate-dependent enzyme [Halobacteriovoraceae bacterium]|nr:thiamine pyrophosphate-dependent enzyme [Halobacteriovoraceae bacterium]